MRTPERQGASSEVAVLLVLDQVGPIQMIPIGILAARIVVLFLASVELIAAGKHGNPGRYKRQKKAVAGGLPLLAETGVQIPGDATWQIERIEIA